jgi:hypothetical protein
MTDLSPAAQAVLDATGRKTWWRNDDIAAALRAAATHLRSEEYAICNGSSYAMMIEVDDLLDLATELEAQ